jgi:hypothetical protein
MNKTFKDNWMKILKFNENREILKDPEKVKEYLRIPLSPISINANLLYQLFELLYPRFINDQQNILDIIISDENKKNKIQRLYLYKTKTAGIHETVESLPSNIVRIKTVEDEDLDDIFDKLQKAIIKEKNIRISLIRLFRKEAIELINKHCEGIEKISIYEFLVRFIDLVQKIIYQDLILIYPEPIVIKFLRNLFSLLDKIQLKTIFRIIEKVCPEFNLSFLIDGNAGQVIIHIQKQLSKFGKSNLKLDFLTPDTLEIDLNNSDIKNNLKLIQNKLETENVYYLYQKDIISFISECFELAIPLKKEKIGFLIQKALFGYRSFENHWYMIPRPKIYNTLIRFSIRLFGFNLNLKKISHWAIPNLIFNYIDFYIGLNSRILFIFTDQEKIKRGKTSQGRIFKTSCNHIILLEFEESTLQCIKPINKEELFSSSHDSIASIKEKITEKFGYTSAIVFFDKILLQRLIDYFILNHSNFTIWHRFKTLKMLKNEKYFRVYPEFPFYKLIKKKRTTALIKLLLPILIDKHEF